LRLFEEYGPPNYGGGNAHGMSTKFDDIDDTKRVEEILEVAVYLAVTGEAMRVTVISLSMN
jgi:hypothetical protein